MLFSSYCKSVISNNTFANHPRMIQDMLRTTAGYRECKEFNHIKAPLLEVTGGSDYNLDDIVKGITWLMDNEFSSFVVCESSTYCLRLLNAMLTAPSRCNTPFTLSIHNGYNKIVTSQWGDQKQIIGVIVKITKRNVHGILPGNVIQ